MYRQFFAKIVIVNQMMKQKKRTLLVNYFRFLGQFFQPYGEKGFFGMAERPIVEILQYSAHCLIGSRLMESAAYCNQILLVPLYSKQNTTVN